MLGRMPPADKQPGQFRFRRYAFAVFVVLVAVTIRIAMDQLVPLKSPFLLLFAAVMSAAAFGGLGPGVLATTLAAVASDFFMVGWPSELSEVRITNHAQLVLFFLEGLFLSLLGAMLHNARERARAADATARRLEQKILDVSESERRRIGHDLHDGLGQHLTGIALQAKLLNQRLSAADVPEAEQAARIAKLVNESIAWTRDLARGLSPLSLEGGLPAALEELAANASNLLGIRCTSQCEAPRVSLSRESVMHLYRIAQEAINNSVKHGKANRVEIGISADNGQIVMSVADNGTGLSEKTRSNPGIGLQIMEYRARMIGASLSVERAPGPSGTIVRCSVPASDGHAEV
jgi:signal transduction histidine kinase